MIVDIGGGANPVLSEFKAKRFKYVVVDINQQELDKAVGTYFEKVCTDICKDDKGLKCDLIITKMLLEHIPNPKYFHLACYKMLNQEGLALHFFATKYSISSILNRILPEKISRRILFSIQKRKWETEGKFPAYYRWCMGPTNLQIRKFQELKFEIKYYTGYIGSSYLMFVSVAKYFERIFNKFLEFINSPYCCSNAILILKKYK